MAKKFLIMSAEDVARFNRINDQDQFLYPILVKNRCQKMTCKATGVPIPKGQECIILVASEVRERVALFADLEAFQMFLDAGSIESLMHARENRREQEIANRPQPIFPHQQMCYCVQCGGRIIRPAEMTLVEFAAIYRCEKCQQSGGMMPIDKDRFCRTCGVPFTPPSGKHGASRRLCLRCRK